MRWLVSSLSAFAVSSLWPFALNVGEHTRQAGTLTRTETHTVLGVEKMGRGGERREGGIEGRRGRGAGETRQREGRTLRQREAIPGEHFARNALEVGTNSPKDAMVSWVGCRRRLARPAVTFSYFLGCSRQERKVC